MPVPLDEFPIHQGPESMKYFVTSDRNVYDRCIMHALDRTGELQLAAGLGVYPGVGVIDCYVAIRQGRSLTSLRTSGSLSDDRMRQQVGPMTVDVVKGLETVAFRCEGAEHGVEVDLTWQAAVPATDEPRHIRRQGETTILDAFRFVQPADVTGRVRVDDRVVEATDWVGARDRSWGVRPVGDATSHAASVRRARDVVVLDPAALRRLCADVRAGRGAGRPPDDQPRRTDPARRPRRAARLARGRHRVRTGNSLSDSRAHRPEGARGARARARRRAAGADAASVGLGYGPEDDGWNHGRWMGEQWTQRVDHDLDAEATKQRVAWSMIDHAARATLDGQTGYGIFEHLCIGRHDPSGFPDLMTMA